MIGIAVFVHEDPIHVVVRSETPALVNERGQRVTLKQRRVFAKFVRGTAPAYAVKAAEGKFEMRNRPGEIAPAQWLACYDSLADPNDWTAEERKLIEQTLTDRGYLAVVPEKLEPPYPLYDKHRKTAGRRTIDKAIADIVAAYELAGFNLDDAIAYERENANSDDVVAALEALKTPGEAAVEEEVIAA